MFRTLVLTLWLATLLTLYVLRRQVQRLMLTLRIRILRFRAFLIQRQMQRRVRRMMQRNPILKTRLEKQHYRKPGQPIA